MKMEAYEKEHLKRIRKYLGECAVLLKSNGDFPLEAPGRIAAFGSGVRHTIKGGTGSGDVNSRFTVNVETGLEKSGFTLVTKGWLNDYDEILEQSKKDFIADIKAQARKAHMPAVMFGMGAVMPEPEYELPLDGDADTAVYVLARISGEGNDRTDDEGDIRLTQTEIRDILALKEKYPKFMLVLNTGGVVDLSPVLEVENILYLSQLGADTGLALAQILLGKQNPSGKLASTWAAWEDYPTLGEFGDIDETRYYEGVYVGYRYFDTAGVKPLFPFGYGLSYTSFAVENTGISLDGETVTVTASVENTGAYAGKEVVQVYVSKPEGLLDQPCEAVVYAGKVLFVNFDWPFPGMKNKAVDMPGTISAIDYEEVTKFVKMREAFQTRMGPQGDRPRGPRAQGDRPQGDRPRGPRAQGDRPRGPRGQRPQGDRPQGN